MAPVLISRTWLALVVLGQGLWSCQDTHADNAGSRPGTAATSPRSSLADKPDTGEMLLTATYNDDDPRWLETRPLTGGTITCDFRVEASTEEADAGLGLKLTRSKEPLVLSFTGLDTKNPRIKGNAGEGPLDFARRDALEIVLVERNEFGNVFTYTISPARRMAIWTKSYFMLGQHPSGRILVGRCW